MVRLLCDRNIDFEALGDHGQGMMTALDYAVDAENNEMVRLLVENGANVNKPIGEFETTLQMAITKSQEEIVHLLLLGAVDGQNKEGALIHALLIGAENMVKILLESGAGRRIGQDEDETKIPEASTQLAFASSEGDTKINSEDVEDFDPVLEDEKVASLAVLEN